MWQIVSVWHDKDLPKHSLLEYRANKIGAALARPNSTIIIFYCDLSAITNELMNEVSFIL